MHDSWPQRQQGIGKALSKMYTQAEDRKLQLSRVNQLAVLVIVAFMILLARLWYLQIALGDDLLQQSEANRIKLLRARAPRGTILDRNNRILATSRPQFVVLAIPEMLKTNPQALHTLCGVLSISPEELQSIVKKDNPRPGSPVRIKIDVDLKTVARIGELRMKLPGVSVELDQIRNYPDGPAVAHIMGYLGEISQKELDKSKDEGTDYRPGDYVGKAGLEKQYERYLRGVDGGKQVEVNALGRVVRILGEASSTPGSTLKLTIDRDLQVAAYRAFGKQVGAVVAVDPRTGGILAMVSKPDYDPNIFVKRVKTTDWSLIINNRLHPLQNRCVSSAYPPGSTFKPIMAVAGLTEKACNIHTSVFCPGSFHLGRARFGCWEVHHQTDFTKAIAQSCDVWFYTLARRMGIDTMAKYAREFGIASPTGIDLPSEPHRIGSMPDTKWKRERFHEGWYPGETVISGIGQGYVTASPLQMSLACAGVANSGKIMQPFLVKQVQKSSGKTTWNRKTIVNRRVNAPEESFKIVRAAMRETVVAGTGGVCNVPGIEVGGKTGSAETTGPAHGWFICFSRVGKPEIAIAAIVEHGRHGASTAAPVCRAILDVYYGKKKPGDIGNTKAHVRGD